MKSFFKHRKGQISKTALLRFGSVTFVIYKLFEIVSGVNQYSPIL